MIVRTLTFADLVSVFTTAQTHYYWDWCNDFEYGISRKEMDIVFFPFLSIERDSLYSHNLFGR